MKTLNLVYPDQSDIRYNISKFPDGQQNIVLLDERLGGNFYLLRYVEDGKQPVKIKSCLNNWLDLELIVCTVASLRELGVEEIHLYVPYIMGARSDRKFEEGGNNYLRDVICPIINSLNFKTVTCIDPHSDVLEACIKGFRKEFNERLVRWSLANIQKNNGNGQSTNLFNNCILVSPDAGASKKIYKLAEQIGYKGDIITSSKDRDVDGKLTMVNVPYQNTDFRDKDFIIIDDICDGGATFINIAKHLNNGDFSKKPKIYLIVTHGIFSKGFEELSKYFDGIYCTNSYSDLDIRLAVNRAINTEFPNNFVKQLNVF